MDKRKLTVELLCKEAQSYAALESGRRASTLFGVTDGKTVGTYLEHNFQAHLRNKYSYDVGNSARGIDLPDLGVDIKVTRSNQPQSSCPYRSARQKVYGLGYSLLVFVYDKSDDLRSRTAQLDFVDTIFVKADRTADFQTTSGVLKILNNHGNIDDIIAFLMERRLPVDDIEATRIARDILKNPPQVGYLTISNALQWRLQYRRVIDLAGTVEGVQRVW